MILNFKHLVTKARDMEHGHWVNKELQVKFTDTQYILKPFRCGSEISHWV